MLNGVNEIGKEFSIRIPQGGRHIFENRDMIIMLFYPHPSNRSDFKSKNAPGNTN